MPYDLESQAPIILHLSPINHTTNPDHLLLPTPTSRLTAHFSTSTYNPNTLLLSTSTSLFPDKPSLGPIPPVIKSRNGNLFWADEACVRRVGLTLHEARLFLQLQNGNYNYREYVEMFHSFGEEKKHLEERLRELQWWRVERKKVWEKRVEWLGRLEEPRLWLLYLMARRRRILLVACRKVLGRLREKRDARLKGQAMGMGMEMGEEEGRKLQRNSQAPTIACSMVSRGSQTSRENEIKPMKSCPMRSEGTQTGDLTPSESEPSSNITSHPISRPASKHSHHSHSHSHTCPVFAHPYSATSSSIQTLTSLLLPPQTPYLILGYFPTTSLDPHETYIPLPTPTTLFSSLHRAEHSLRGYRRFLSLKSLAGFGLYKCDIEKGAHVKVILREEEKMVLRRFYAAYKGKMVRGLPGFAREEWDEDVGEAWMKWVGSNLNGGKEETGEEAGGPLEGRWSLELVYDWCPYRLSAVVITPLLLSLIVGVWYMESNGDVITAWTLALYIVTAAAAIVALLGIIGSLKDV
ncbi:hypothetical protein OCU04_009182 [Sclerotinia nivalis]|uniref:Uncharacterized protein n=1 Tax=Sclerotinia nivalis TaxID=352851 RepID=A0A9X0AGZ1_9HELO|nr:hypothetical protein OCU04_009182 [Sclerotinia nivalis]